MTKVNSRDPVIVTDAELSIVKVAQLERVLYYSDTSRPTVQSLLSEYSSSAGTRMDNNWCWIYVWLGLVILVWIHNGDGCDRCQTSDTLSDLNYTGCLHSYTSYRCDVLLYGDCCHGDGNHNDGYH